MDRRSKTQGRLSRNNGIRVVRLVAGQSARRIARAIGRSFHLLLVGSVCAGAALSASAQAPQLSLQHVTRIPDTKNPELLYWFISPSEIKDQAYVRDLNTVAANGTFNMIFLSQREGADFYDYSTMHPIFKDLVARAHAKGIKIGLQLWTDDKRVPADQTQGVVVENEVKLDATGGADITSASKSVRLTGNSADVPRVCLRSELLHAYAFKKTADGEYSPRSVVDITDRARVTARTTCSVSLHVQASPRLAGFTVYVMTVHYHRYPDMFSPYMTNSFIEALRAYKDVGFDGTALDEFGYMAPHKTRDELFRERWYSKNMATFYRKRTGQELIRTLFEMRYAPQGDPRPRARAINNYFDTLRQGPLRVEQKFYRATNEIFGPQAFHGIHDTFHNHLNSDEIWTTCINWWSIPRVYSQTDESEPMPIALGMGLAHPKAVEYDQHYGSIRSFVRRGIYSARFNVRVHYHALNDQHGWGVDMRTPEMLQKVSAVEDKVRLLNYFDAPRPAMNVLFVFGFPALADWFPNEGQRNEWDINGDLDVEKKAVAAWNAGYRGAVASSVLIDEGKITADDHGGILYGGHRFTALVYIGPQYSKDATLRLLERFARGGGKLMFDGTATEDFEAREIRARFNKLEHSAVATSFDVDSMSKLGIPKLAIDDGAVYEDGSVVLSDEDSLMNNQPKPFSLNIEGHVFSGTYEGLLAIKSNADGHVEKLAGGGLQEVKCDGKPVVDLSVPSDVVLSRVGNSYHGFIRGDASITVH